MARKTGIQATASAFSKARQRLPLKLTEAVAQEMADRLIETSERFGDRVCWRGLRVFVLDGTGFSMPDTPANKAAFGTPTNNKSDKPTPGRYSRAARC